MNKREFLKGSAAVAAAVAMSGFAESAEATSTNVPRVNWSGNYHYSTDKVFQPRTVSEVQDAVRSVTRVRALGSRHSFNSIADSTVAQISMLGLKNVELDAASKTVRVGAGVQYDDLSVQLDDEGWALQNLASLTGITVGGACSTATHGSGTKNQNLSTQVQEIEFVTGDGSLHVLSRAKDGDRFAGAVVALGALGIMTHMTLAVEPRYEMTQVVYENLPFSVLEHHLADVMDAAYSVSLFTHWDRECAEQVWLKRRVDQGGSGTP
ncbi:MAG: FAD-binding protein, partial [Acidobacteriaceae bacterium]